MSQLAANPIPFSEPPYLCGLPSPYYTPAHRRFQTACRQFMWDNLLSHALEYERAGEVPAWVYDTFCQHHMLLPNLGAPLPVDWLKRLGIHEILGVKVEDWDYLYSGIYFDELSRSGLAGVGASLNAGFSFGIPPILNHASPAFQERFLPDLLTGRKRCCIAITEPAAGSDVANITTTATKTADGQHYLLNGTKKWITNGIWSHYATMAVRTGGPGPAGLSVVLVPLQDHRGVSMRRLRVSGQRTGGTTYIELDAVRVPVGNLIGREGDGMRMIMTNFNHERVSIAVGVTRQARVALSSAFQYCLKREAFGKTLMDQPVVRHRLAQAGAELETLGAFVEQLLYQLCHLPKDEADRKLGGISALAKAKAGMVLNECAQCAVLLFGGAGFTQSGQGELAEAILRDVPGARIPGGSEDVLLDLSVRQLVKLYRAEERKLKQSKI
ncbi:acyl-CoA dehydrogenase [Aspergillus ellipticus CBS 707.79]|uniref:Acyl-CoA dehydrogenase n=1 Tax=Aspergillus ellipticus CBS 707.79 TaxID=1448320 RepID=A0A319D9K4_9EURO|nr:acyl-CoA dehydrogenase [Aspergillus ellipticus CBS 707.79]